MPRMTTYRHGVPAWVDVSSPDVEQACVFYTRLFGWEVGPDMGPDTGGYRLFLKDGAKVAGVGPLMDEGPPSWTTYVAVDDIEREYGRIQALGGHPVVPPMELPDESGHIAYATDPTGGFFALFQSGPGHLGAELVNEPGTLAWNELVVRDPDTATAFYDELFGWNTVPLQDMDYRIVQVAGRAVGGVMPMGANFPAEMPTHWLAYFAVEDARATTSRCVSMGGDVVAGPMDTPIGPIAVIQDPAGAMFAIGQFSTLDDPNDWPADVYPRA